MQERLDAGQYRGNVIRRRPSVLQDVEAKSAIIVDVGMEHLGNELDSVYSLA